MILGVLTLRFALHDNHSLKGKRQFAASLKQKLRGGFNVAVAEVGDQEALNRLTLAVVAVSTDARRIQSQMSKILEMVEAVSTEDLADAHLEIIPAGSGEEPEDWTISAPEPMTEACFGEGRAQD
jgi:uncharacterized protein YlxP (DUF503 family)